MNMALQQCVIPSSVQPQSSQTMAGEQNMMQGQAANDEMIARGWMGMQGTTSGVYMQGAVQNQVALCDHMPRVRPMNASHSNIREQNPGSFSQPHESLAVPDQTGGLHGQMQPGMPGRVVYVGPTEQIDNCEQIASSQCHIGMQGYGYNMRGPAPAMYRQNEHGQILQQSRIVPHREIDVQSQLLMHNPGQGHVPMGQLPRVPMPTGGQTRISGQLPMHLVQGPRPGVNYMGEHGYGNAYYDQADRPRHAMYHEAPGPGGNGVVVYEMRSPHAVAAQRVMFVRQPVASQALRPRIPPDSHFVASYNPSALAHSPAAAYQMQNWTEVGPAGNNMGVYVNRSQWPRQPSTFYANMSANNPEHRFAAIAQRTSDLGVSTNMVAMPRVLSPQQLPSGLVRYPQRPSMHTSVYNASNGMPGNNASRGVWLSHADRPQATMSNSYAANDSTVPGPGDAVPFYGAMPSTGHVGLQNDHTTAGHIPGRRLEHPPENNYSGSGGMCGPFSPASSFSSCGQPEFSPHSAGSSLSHGWVGAPTPSESGPLSPYNTSQPHRTPPRQAMLHPQSVHQHPAVRYQYQRAPGEYTWQHRPPLDPMISSHHPTSVPPQLPTDSSGLVIAAGSAETVHQLDHSSAPHRSMESRMWSGPSGMTPFDSRSMESFSSAPVQAQLPGSSSTYISSPMVVAAADARPSQTSVAMSSSPCQQINQQDVHFSAPLLSAALSGAVNSHAHAFSPEASVVSHCSLPDAAGSCTPAATLVSTGSCSLLTITSVTAAAVAAALETDNTAFQLAPSSLRASHDTSKSSDVTSLSHIPTASLMLHDNHPSATSDVALNTDSARPGSPKATKRSGSRKRSGKSKRKKLNSELTDDMLSGSFVTPSYGLDETVMNNVAPISEKNELSMHADRLSKFDELRLPRSISVSMSADVPKVSTLTTEAPVIVPYGWKRSIEQGSVVYYSPTETRLSCLDEVRRYLLSDGTCKCGLQCPLIVEKTFVFDARLVISRHLLAEDIRCDSDRSNNLCNHRRKIVAMATFQQSTGLRFNRPDCSSAVQRLPEIVAAPVTVQSSLSGLSTEVKPITGFSSRPQSETAIASVASTSTASVGTCSASCIHPASSSAVMQPSDQRSGNVPLQAGTSREKHSPDSQRQVAVADPFCAMDNYARNLRFPQPQVSPQMLAAAGVPPNYVRMPNEHDVVFMPQHVQPYAQFRMPQNVYEYGSMPTGGMVWIGSPQRPAAYVANPMMNNAAAGHDFAAVMPPASDTWVQPTPAARPPRSRKRARGAGQKETYSSILERSEPCPNIDVRQIIREQQERLQQEAATCGASGQSGAVYVSSAMQSIAACMNPQSTSVAINAPETGRSGSSITVPCTAVSNAAVANQETCSPVKDLREEVSPGTCQKTSPSSSSCVTSMPVNFPHSSAAASSPSVHQYTNPTNVSNPNLRAALARPSLSNMCQDLHYQSAPYAAYDPRFVIDPRMPQFAGMRMWSHRNPCFPDQIQSPCVAVPAYHSPYSVTAGPHVGFMPASGATVSPASGTELTAGSDTRFLNSSPSSGGGTVAASNDESPIRLVQNMVSGLETTQNSLALATSMIISRPDAGPRRRKSGSLENAARAAQCAVATAGHLAENVETTMPAASESAVTDAEVLQTSAGGSICVAASFATSDDMRQSTSPTSKAVTSALAQVIPAAGIVPSTTGAPGCHQTSLQSSPPVLSISSTAGTAVTAAIASNVSAATVTAISSLPESKPCTIEGSTDPSTHESNVDCRIADDDESTQDCDDIQAEAPSSEASEAQTSKLTTHSSQSPPSELTRQDEATPTPLLADGTSSSSSSTSKDEAVKTSPAVAAKTELNVTRSVSDVMPSSIATSTPIVVMPPVQTPFVLPPNIAFAAGSLVSHGFLQLQHPGDFNFGGHPTSCAVTVGQPGTLGLVHFAASPMVGPPHVSTLMAPSDPSATGLRLMTPMKSDSSMFSAADFLHLMTPTAMPTGHILVQNIVPAGLASGAATIVPFVQPATLCSIPGGPSTLFAVSQNSGLGLSLGTPLAFGPIVDRAMAVREPAPDPPDSTVDNNEADITEEAGSDDSVDLDRVTSTERPAGVKNDDFSCSATSKQSMKTEFLSSSAAETGSPSTDQGEASKTDVDGSDGSDMADKKKSRFHGGESSIHGKKVGKMASHKRHKSLDLHHRSSDQQKHLHTSLSSHRHLSKCRTRLRQITKCRERTSSLEKVRRRLRSSSGIAFRSALHTDSDVTNLACFRSTTDDSSDGLDAGAIPNSAPGPSSPASLQPTSGMTSDCSVSTTLSVDECDDAERDRRLPSSRANRRRLRSSQGLPSQWKRRTMAKIHRDSSLGSSDKSVPSDSASVDPPEQDAEDVDGADSTTGTALSSSPRTFNIGDLVWGPSRGYPSWPGKLVSESEVRGNHKLETGKIWVRWFGDHTFAQAEPDQLKTLSEGLETHHNARKKYRQGRKMNPNLEAAIQEAMTELDRQMDEQSHSSTATPERTGKSRASKKSKK